MLQFLDLTTVIVNWGSFEYLTLEQELKYSSVSEFIGAVGGAIGIWLGLSVLSLLQVITRFFQKTPLSGHWFRLRLLHFKMYWRR